MTSPVPPSVASPTVTSPSLTHVTMVTVEGPSSRGASQDELVVTLAASRMRPTVVVSPDPFEQERRRLQAVLDENMERLLPLATLSTAQASTLPLAEMQKAVQNMSVALDEFLNQCKEQAQKMSVGTQASRWLAHELRTPLVCLRAALERGSDLDPQELEDHYHWLAMTLVGVNGGLTRETLKPPAPVPLQGLCERVQRRMSRYSPEKQVAITFAIEPAVAPVLMGQGALIELILTNFLSNAIKYSGVQEIEVFIQLTRKGDLLFRVKDKGRGLSPEEKQQLFRPFAQIKTDAESRVSSSGIGLYNCKYFAELMNDPQKTEVIGVDSEGIGTGSTFWFTVPHQSTTELRLSPEPVPRPSSLTPPPPSPAPTSTLGSPSRMASPIPQPQYNPEGVRVLVADDDGSMRTLYQRWFTAATTKPGTSIYDLLARVQGLAVFTSVCDGEQAIQAMERSEKPYDLVVLDMNMRAKNDGAATALKIQKMLQGRPCPYFIFVSGEETEDTWGALEGVQGALSAAHEKSIVEERGVAVVKKGTSLTAFLFIGTVVQAVETMRAARQGAAAAFTPKN